MTELKHVLDKLVFMEQSSASMYVTRETIHLRVLQRIATCLEISTEKLKNLKELSFVHPSVSRFIEDTWKRKSSNVLTENELDMVLERFLAKDYHRTSDLLRFCLNVQKFESHCLSDETKNENMRNYVVGLWNAFAVDGLRGHEYKKYIDNLSIPYPENESNNKTCLNGIENSLPDAELALHVNAIRSIYEFAATKDYVTPKHIARALHNFFLSKDPMNVIKSSMSWIEQGVPVQTISESENESDAFEDDSHKENRTIQKIYFQSVGPQNFRRVVIWIKEYIKKKQEKVAPQKKKLKMTIKKTHKQYSVS